MMEDEGDAFLDQIQLADMEEPQFIDGDLEEPQCIDDGELSPQNPSAAVPEPDVAVSREDYNQALFTAALSNAPACEMRLPWEQGIFGVICGQSSDNPFSNPLDVPILPAEFPAPAVSANFSGPEIVQRATRPVVLPLHTTVVQALRDEDAFQQLDRLWDVAIAKWLTLIATLGFPGTLGSAIVATGGDDQQSAMVLRDTLGIRSPRTAIKRALTIQRFLNWMKASGESIEYLDRTHVLRYLASDGEKQPAATAGTSLMEAFRFCKYVLDINFSDSVLQDPQILGRVQRLRVTGNYRPARDLLVCEVVTLENLMSVLSDPFDVYILGCCIFTLYSRSRWSDLQHLQTMWCERYTVRDGEVFGFVEARTRFHKTGSSMERKLRYMPLVAPINGITKVDWTHHWLNAMSKVGFNFQAQPVGALCRPPLQDGTLADRSLTSDEASRFLRRVLGIEDQDVKSHSLKHTTLAWCAKYGIDESSRTLLGHHELPGRS